MKVAQEGTSVDTTINPSTGSNLVQRELTLLPMAFYIMIQIKIVKNWQKWLLLCAYPIVFLLTLILCIILEEFLILLIKDGLAQP